MNARLKELTSQAVDYTASQHPASRDWYPIQNTKLAELIVQECANIIAQAVAAREPASTYVDKLKQNFGIK